MEFKFVMLGLVPFFVDGKKEETIKEFIKHRDFLHAMGAKVIAVPNKAVVSKAQQKLFLKK